MSVKQLGGLALRSLHTRAFPSGERAASGLLAGHVVEIVASKFLVVFLLSQHVIDDDQ